jgi:hypothetical protein
VQASLTGQLHRGNPLVPVSDSGLRAAGSDSPDEQCHQQRPDDGKKPATDMTSSMGHPIDPFGP